MTKSKDPSLSGILSFLVPGLGQVYCGKIGRGIIIFIVAFIGYCCFVIPGVIVWIWGIVDAVNQAKKIK